MKTKMYTREWFYNAGIIGFLRILEHSQKDFVNIQENYIEFDTKDLKDFAQDYFQYFFDIYNVAKKITEKIEVSFNKIGNYLEQNDSAGKEIQNKIKSEKKYIRATLKSQLDKIKKIDEEIYDTMQNQYERIEKANTVEELENIKEIIKREIEKPNINERITMNLFKSILSKNYFGQPSFLNVVKTSLSYQEQQEVMYKDYISNIIEIDFLQEIINGTYEIEEIKEHIKNQKSELLTKEMQQIYHNINKKYMEKGKPLTEMQNYIQEKVFSTCYMCENEHTITGNYSESNFAPLAISSDNMKNFFWNQNAEFPVCDICKLILFCIPAGITTTTKIIKEQGQTKYKEKEILTFVNYDASIEDLKKNNNYFSARAKRDKSMENPYSDLIRNIVEQNKKISNWQLENVFIVEFETEYGAYSRMQYFNIKRYVGRFFVEYANATLVPIKNNSYKLQIIDHILKNKELKYIIHDRLREELEKDKPFGFYSYLASKIRVTLSLLKKEGNDVEEEIKKNNAKLNVLYNIGIEIHQELKKKGEDNKINGYAYKMLNSIRAGNKKELMDTILRIHISMGKEVSPIFIEIMKDSNLDFEAIGHSFLAGLISERKEENKEVKVNE